MEMNLSFGVPQRSAISGSTSSASAFISMVIRFILGNIRGWKPGAARCWADTDHGKRG